MDIDIGQPKEAFITLFSLESWIKHDSGSTSHTEWTGPIVSLEDHEDLGQLSRRTTVGAVDSHRGGGMEKDVHLTACSDRYGSEDMGLGQVRSSSPLRG